MPALLVSTGAIGTRVFTKAAVLKGEVSVRSGVKGQQVVALVRAGQ